MDYQGLTPARNRRNQTQTAHRFQAIMESRNLIQPERSPVRVHADPIGQQASPQLIRTLDIRKQSVSQTNSPLRNRKRHNTFTSSTAVSENQLSFYKAKINRHLEQKSNLQQELMQTAKLAQSLQKKNRELSENLKKVNILYQNSQDDLQILRNTVTSQTRQICQLRTNLEMKTDFQVRKSFNEFELLQKQKKNEKEWFIQILRDNLHVFKKLNRCMSESHVEKLLEQKSSVQLKIKQLETCLHEIKEPELERGSSLLQLLSAQQEFNEDETTN